MAAEPLDLKAPDVEPLSTVRDFDVLYRQHFDRLRRFCLGMTGQDSLAEDIAQETLLRAYVRMAEFDFSRPLWPWLKRVASHLVVDHVRAAQREVLDVEPAEGATDDDADAAAERQLLNDALRALPVRQRMALALRYIDDWKPAEVGDLLGLNRPAVEQLLHRARRRMCSEYRRLDGEVPARLRVALWPLILVLGRLRDRITRLRNAMGDGGNSLVLAADGTTHAVVALTLAGVLAGGVAVAETLPPRQEVAKATMATATTAETRDAGRSVATASTQRATTATTRTSAPAAHHVVNESQAAEPATGTDSTTSVEVSAPEAPINDAPAKPEAKATKTRSGDVAGVSGTVGGHVADKAPGSRAALSVDCDGSAVWGAACAATDKGEGLLTGR